MKYLANITYDGSKFYGSAKQKNKKTIQGIIEDKLSKRFNTEVTISMSSRTDRGVHSTDSYFHFEEKATNIKQLKRYLNESLNGEIFIRSIKEERDDFHARYSVVEKTYLYIINTGEYNPVDKNYILQYTKPIDIKKIKKAAKYLEGSHNFKYFTPSSNKQDTYVRRIIDINIEKDKDCIYIYITGTGFLQYMVRNIINLFIEVNEGKVTNNDLKTLFKSSKSHNKPIIASGLYLYKTKY